MTKKVKCKTKIFYNDVKIKIYELVNCFIIQKATFGVVKSYKNNFIKQ